MTSIYGGHLVAKHLKEMEGIETVFSLSGGHIDRIYDGFLEYGVRLIDVRHEQAAAMMAHAWTLYAGQPGVCLVTAGPGFTNALTGLVNASLENAPVVLLCGTAPIRDAQKGALQEMNQADMVKAFVKWQAVCHDARRIPEYLATAFRKAVSGRPGPVFLELPPEVLNVSVESDQVSWTRRGGVPYRPRAEGSAVEKAAHMINRAKRPLILGGTGLAYSACDDEFRQFVERTGIPFFLLNAGRGTLPDEHPLSLWDGGQMGALTALSQADLVLALGVRFQWQLLFGQAISPEASLIRLDVEASELDRNREADVGLCGDIRLTLQDLLPRLEEGNHDPWLAALRQSYLPLAEEEKALARKAQDPIHPARLVALMREVFGDEAFYVTDGGDTSYYGLMGLRATSRASVLGASGGQLGCLGTGIPFGIAAKAAQPDRAVVVLSGDGSFGLNAMEFHTAARHNLPFVCVICNDCAWGMIKHGQELAYGGDRVIGSQLGITRYDLVVEALGGHGEFVQKEAEILPALQRARESGKPACVNVLTDPTVCSPATLLFVNSLKME